jgi:hypothetical protein
LKYLQPRRCGIPVDPVYPQPRPNIRLSLVVDPAGDVPTPANRAPAGHGGPCMKYILDT